MWMWAGSAFVAAVCNLSHVVSSRGPDGASAGFISAASPNIWRLFTLFSGCFIFIVITALAYGGSQRSDGHATAPGVCYTVWQHENRDVIVTSRSRDQS